MSETDEQQVWLVANTSKTTSDQRYHNDRECRQLQNATHAVRCVPLPDAERRERSLCQICWSDGHAEAGRGVICPHCGDEFGSLGRHIPCPEGPDPAERGGIRQ